MAVGSPVAAWSQTLTSLDLTPAASTGDALMLCLQAATPCGTAGLFAMLLAAGPAAPLVELGVAGALAGVLTEELLLLPPQPASSAPPVSATTHSVQSLVFMFPP